MKSIVKMKSLLLQQQIVLCFNECKRRYWRKINDIIKEGQECPEVFDQVATISINKYLDQNSLYLPRQIKKLKIWI